MQVIAAEACNRQATIFFSTTANHPIDIAVLQKAAFTVTCEILLWDLYFKTNQQAEATKEFNRIIRTLENSIFPFYKKFPALIPISEAELTKMTPGEKMSIGRQINTNKKPY